MSFSTFVVNTIEVSPCLRRSGYAQAGLKLSQPPYLPHGTESHHGKKDAYPHEK